MENINFHSCLKVDNKIWFISVDGYLMNFDIIKYQSEIIAPYNLSDLKFKQVIDNLVSINDKIYFVEQDGSKLYEYDLITNYCNYYLIPKTEFINWGCFSGIYLLEENIYLFARVAGTVFCFNTNNKKFTCIRKEISTQVIVTNSYRIKNKFYLYGEKIVCFNTDDNSFTESCCFGQKDVYWISIYQDTILFLTRNRIDSFGHNGKTKKIIYEEEGLSDKIIMFFATKNKIFMLPNQSKDILVLDKGTNGLLYTTSPADLYYVENGWAKYWGYTESDRYVWCANRVSNYVVCLDKENEEIKWIKVKKPDLREEIPYLELSQKQFFNENKVSIEQFLLINRNAMQYRKSLYGKRIWKTLR